MLMRWWGRGCNSGQGAQGVRPDLRAKQNRNEQFAIDYLQSIVVILSMIPIIVEVEDRFGFFLYLFK